MVRVKKVTTETAVRKYRTISARTATPLNQANRVSTGSLPLIANGSTSATAMTVWMVAAIQGAP